MNKLILGIAVILFVAGILMTTTSIATLSEEEIIEIKHFSTKKLDKCDTFYYRYNAKIITAPYLKRWRSVASLYHLNQTEIDRIVNTFKQLARNETQSLVGIEGGNIYSSSSIYFKIFDLETEEHIDAEIYVDGNKYTTHKVVVSPGEHTIQIKKDGYYDTGVRTIKIGSHLTYVAVTMIPLPPEPPQPQPPEFEIPEPIAKNPIGVLLMLSAIPVGIYGWKHD
ncbi:hypothetical protein DRJ17_06290 [Candidatus Woesearchaeota archaeon]|nr:MAG: hypothetical protein DRJ17_06290 [Candidatus Woesearchaeota archaeon]